LIVTSFRHTKKYLVFDWPDLQQRHHHQTVDGRPERSRDVETSLGNRAFDRPFSFRGAERETAMGRVMLILSILIVSQLSVSAQQAGRPLDGFYFGQSNGQVDERVDGRASKNEGLPPSAADRGNSTFDNPISADDCFEVEALNPNVRPGYQARVREACGE
jgi:hypothetical protein